jgi:hypothetical protein
MIILGLPLAGHRARRRAGDCCALDGVPIESVYRVRILDDQGQSSDFCCLKCAELWLKAQQARPRTILVTDEVSGREVEADRAYFVQSTVVTTPTTGNHVHTFESEAAAQRHADRFGGIVLEGADRPFADRE